MIAAQALSGAAGAVIVPSLVALIAENYRGRQQAAAGRAGLRPRRRRRGGFLIGGILGTYIGWRPAFGILIGGIGLVFCTELPAEAGRAAGRADRRVIGVISRGSRNHPDQLRLQ